MEWWHVEDECEYELMHGEHDWTEPKQINEVDGNPIYMRKCKSCGLEEEEALIVEYWENKSIEILGKKYKALKAWGNISVCAECNKVIMDVPLILWDEKDKSMAITFHFECAERIGLMDLIRTKSVFFDLS